MAVEREPVIRRSTAMADGAIVPLGHAPAPPRVERENPPTREPDVVERLLRNTIG